MTTSNINGPDSYKPSQFNQYPPDTQGLFGYIEARKKTPGNDFTVFNGLQPILDTMSQRITRYDIHMAEDRFAQHGIPFNKAGWEYILAKHGGNLPILIRAIPEGSVVPNGNALVTVESTDEHVPWIGSYMENKLLRVWYPCTVATRSYQSKLVIKEFLEQTADDISGLPFKLHDFGSRGVSSGESAAIGGTAHLLNFLGTDTLEAIEHASRYYGEPMAGFSIPAMEHSTVTSWGRDGEAAAYENFLTTYGKPGAIIAAVSDSYDIDNAVSQIWGRQLAQQVVDSGATVVIRPDSGEPAPMVVNVLRRLDAKFGSKVNSKGYKVLNNVRVIQGDGLDGPEDIRLILLAMRAERFSADNIAFGMGGGLLQKVNRDDLGFAMKTSAVKIGGQWLDVFKDPISDPGKRSKAGRLTTLVNKGEYSTVREGEKRVWQDTEVCALRTVFHNGELLNQTTLKLARQRTGLW